MSRTFQAVATATALAAIAVVPAQAHKPADNSGSHQSHKCTPHNVGFTASGKLESAALTQTQGAGTETRSDDRYSGTVTVDVAKASRKGLKGSQEYTLENDRVKLYDAAHDGTADEPTAGDRVKVKGKVTRLAKKCDQSEFTSTTNVRRVEFRPAKVKSST